MNKITLILLLFCVSFLNAQDINYTIRNISKNTKYQDFGVTYYGDSLAVFASSRKDKSIRKRVWFGNKQPFLELYVGKVVENGDIINIERFSKTINTKYHESNVSFTKDLQTVYFTRDNYLDNKIKKDTVGWILNQLYVAKIGDDGKWKNIKPMPFNSDNYQTGHPVLNEKEDKLYFISDMPGGYGLTDIYVVEIYNDGTYGSPQNLGPIVNSNKKEMFPYIDGNDILYYSSNGYKNSYGGLDIYVTKLTNGKVLEKPQNLGFPINSDKDDFNIVFQKNKRVGHFSSNRIGGKGDDDIYYFEELTPVVFECNQIAEGIVREKESGALLPGAKVDLINEKGVVLESTIADKYATFSFKVNCNTAYKVVGSKQDYIEDMVTFTTSNVNELELALNLNLGTNEFVNVRGMLMININPIYFDLDKSFIRQDAAIEIEKVVRIMKKYPKLKIDLGSHTDSRAHDKYNQDLSDRRAKSTIDWIIERGIDPSRITGKGYGETELVNKCANDVPCTEAEHQLNRRTEFVIVNPEEIREY
ncbi:OmpA family protein [Lutibacter sp. B1]|uniref:OmpA family protein n=1 Tax=Lutibacter sp. B1 TaxID=2725996 RepID=UPI001457319D|nr:OmpA family protein [Lutibacter sp. B1]NLP57872.1 OmpA family protein [Lutibacter sp. B1]